MELDEYLQIFCVSGRGIERNDITCVWSKEYNRHTHDRMNHMIESEWLQRCQNNSSLFSALKFRLHHIDSAQKEGDDLPQLTFLLGITDYKDFIGTNCSPSCDVFIREGNQEYDDPQACLSNPLGNGALLITNDYDVILIRRSENCAEFPGFLDRPGGHPEPENVLKSSKQNPEDVSAVAVRDEVFNSILQEINEEVNIPYDKLSEPILMGMSFNPHSAGTPSMEFYVKCDLSTREAQELYETRKAVEMEESTDIIIVPIHDILDGSLEQLCDTYPDLTHGAKCSMCFAKIFFS